VCDHGKDPAEAEKSLFYQVKTSTSHKLTDRYLCFSLRDILALESGRSDRVAMKRSINFGSIFRRKEDQQPPPAGDQTNQAVLLERLAGRSIKLAEGDLSPVSSASPSVDWDIVGGQITILATAIEGILEGRTRIRAQHLKNLSPSPIDADTPDQSEYVVSLPAVIPQIQDLLGTGEPDIAAEPEYETPFTILAKQDGARFAEQTNRPKKEEPGDQLKTGPAAMFPKGTGTPEEIVTAKAPEPEQQEEEEPAPELSLHSTPPVLTLRTLHAVPPDQANEPEPPEKPSDQEDNARQQNEMKNSDSERTEPPGKLASGQIKLFERETGKEESLAGDNGAARLESLRWGGDSSPAGRGMVLLQEIFMTSEPLDGRRVASLVRQFPGVTGALILLERGAVLGGQLPESLNMEAALQTPEVLRNFLQFILELEEGEPKTPRFVTVTSANTISLVSSGQIVLLVSHQGRKLPPGLAQRLTETAQALDLVYAN
jgi:hypothetical protein